MSSNKTTFFVGLLLNDGNISGHAVAGSLEQLFERTGKRKDTSGKSDPPARSETLESFSATFHAFNSVMSSYGKFLPVFLSLVPGIAQKVAEEQFATWARENGSKLDNSSTADIEVLELETKHIREIRLRAERTTASMIGARLLPEVLLIGVISAYDAFLSSLLKVVLTKRSEVVLTSQKQITFKELLEFGSIEHARSTLIDREIDAVIRESHDDQIGWIDKHLCAGAKTEISVWPDFMELCERRNLLTHTGGVISDQYIKNCRLHKCAVGEIRVGEKLSVDRSYYQKAVEVVWEVGLKLHYMLWRKFDQEENDEADNIFNAFCMDLIASRSYPLAEQLLRFAAKAPKLKDDTRRRMIVNLANALRLQDKKGQARALLDKEDWSATSDEFKVCVAAVREDIEKVLALMDVLGKRMPPSDYRDWPVFRGTRRDPRFVERFESIYGEPFLVASQTPALSVAPEEERGADHSSAS